MGTTKASPPAQDQKARPTTAAARPLRSAPMLPPPLRAPTPGSVHEAETLRPPAESCPPPSSAVGPLSARRSPREDAPTLAPPAEATIVPASGEHPSMIRTLRSPPPDAGGPSGLEPDIKAAWDEEPPTDRDPALRAPTPGSSK